MAGIGAINLASIIDSAPIVVCLGGILMLMCSLRGSLSQEKKFALAKRANLVLISGVILALAPSFILTTLWLNPNRLSFGKYVQQEIDLGQDSEVAIRKRLNKFNRQSPQERAAGYGPFAAQSASGLGRELSKPLSPEVWSGAKPAKIEPVEKAAEGLATAQETREAADRQAIVEALIGVAIALGVGIGVAIVARRRKNPVEALPEVRF